MVRAWFMSVAVGSGWFVVGSTVVRLWFLCTAVGSGWVVVGSLVVGCCFASGSFLVPVVCCWFADSFLFVTSLLPVSRCFWHCFCHS